MKNQRLLFLWLCIFFITGLRAQQIISSSGMSFQNQNCFVSFTIGETITGNLQNENCVVSQGFQQAWSNATSIVENSGENVVSLYPNPTNNILNIVGLIPGKAARMKISDIKGNTILETNITENCSFDVSNLPKGFYIAIIDFGESRQIEKLIIH